MSEIREGVWVRAVQEIAEENFRGQARWVHAKAGAIGIIAAVDGDWSTVTWQRTGTTTDCHHTEIERLSGFALMSVACVVRSQIPDLAN